MGLVKLGRKNAVLLRIFFAIVQKICAKIPPRTIKSGLTLLLRLIARVLAQVTRAFILFLRYK